MLDVHEGLSPRTLVDWDGLNTMANTEIHEVFYLQIDSLEVWKCKPRVALLASRYSLVNRRSTSID